MDIFEVKRYGEEDAQEQNHEQSLLEKLKRKIALSKNDGKEESEVAGKNEDSTEPPKKKKKKKKKETQSENSTGFTKLGVFNEKGKSKVKRVLPKWLASPDIISVDLGDQQMPVEDMKQLNSMLKEILMSNGIKYFFPVQRQVIPHLLDESIFNRPPDVCVSAPTGSGKTLAFVLPIVQSLIPRTVPRIRALVILPVQDLAAQIYKVFQAYTERTNLRVKLISGQNSFAQEQSELVIPGVEKGTYHSLADIIIATPGRLVDHIQKTVGFSLTHLRYLIIDEADRVMEDIQNDWLHHLESAVYSDNKFRPRPGPINVASTMLGQMPLQKLLFSATLSQNPEKLEQLKLYEPKLYTSVVDPKDILAKNDDENDEAFVGQFTTPKELSELILVIEETRDKPLMLANLIEQKAMHKVLVFVKSIENSRSLTQILRCLGLNVSEISSSLKRGKRGKILGQFKNDKINVLVTTDALARGIDIGTIDFVVSYDCPKFIKTYIHRIGRTARAGLLGQAVTMIENQQLRHFKAMLKEVGKETDLEQVMVDISEEDRKGYAKAMEEAKLKLSS